MNLAESCSYLREAMDKGRVETPFGVLTCEFGTKEVARKRGGYRTARTKTFFLDGIKIKGIDWNRKATNCPAALLKK